VAQALSACGAGTPASAGELRSPGSGFWRTRAWLKTQAKLSGAAAGA
jgi:hypothetical protein